MGVSPMNFESGSYKENPATSHVACRWKLTLPAGNLNGLADADWTKFDVAGYRETAQNEDADAQLALIPRQYRLDPTVRFSVHFHLESAHSPVSRAAPEAARENRGSLRGWLPPPWPRWPC